MPKATADIRSLARTHTKKAVEVLGGILANGKRDSDRIAAAQALLDRGWGKPEVHVEIDETVHWVISDETMDEDTWSAAHSVAASTGASESTH